MKLAISLAVGGMLAIVAAILLRIYTGPHIYLWFLASAGLFSDLGGLWRLMAVTSRRDYW